MEKPFGADLKSAVSLNAKPHEVFSEDQIFRIDHRTLFTTAESIERLWEVSMPLLDAPPPVQPYPPGAWGPKSVHQLVAPDAWRLPFERAWRDPNPVGS